MSNPFKSEQEAEEAIIRLGGIPKKKTKGAGIGMKKAKPETTVAKGAELEETVKKAFNGRRNHQGRRGGGVSNPDVSALLDWSFEVKHTERLELPAWIRNLKAETPPEKRCGLVFVCDGEPWVTIKLSERANFAADMAEAAGAEVYWP